MIRINLLPPEYRVKERTPLPMLLGILGGVVFCVLVLFVFLYCHIVWLPKAVNDLKEAVFEKEAKQRKVLEYEALIKQQQKYQGLDKMVKDIEASKEKWGIYIKDLVTIFSDAEKENENLLIWISDLGFAGPPDAAPSPGKPVPGGTISFNGDLAGSDFGMYSLFVEEVLKQKEGRTLPQNIENLGEIRLKVTDRQGYIPDKSVSFPFDIQLKAKTPAAAQPAAAAAQPQGAPAGGQPAGGQEKKDDQKKGQ